MAREIQTVPITFANSGIILKSTPDEIPLTAYKMLSNAQTDRENSVSVRKGFSRLNAGLPAPPYSNYFLKDYANRQWRYAITNGQLYVAPVVDPADASVWPIAAHTDFGAVSGGGNLSSALDPRALWTTFTLEGSEMKPYIFFADGHKLLKHSGGMESASRVGIPRPSNAIQSMVMEVIAGRLIEEFEDYTQWAGGSATITTAPDYPSIWFYGAGSLGARWYYAKYTFTLNDDSETFCSSANLPQYIQGQKTARMFWKPAKSTYEIGPRISDGAGTLFVDGLSAPPGGRLSAIKIRYADYQIFNIQLVWTAADGTTVTGPLRGHPLGGSGAGGHTETFTLDFDEYITEVKGKSGDYITQITFVTNKRTSQPYGQAGDSTYSLTVPSPTATQSTVLIGFSGKSQDGRIGSIGLVYRHDSYDNTSTAPVDAVGWNLYVGSSADNVVKVNDTPIALGDVYAEPPGGFEYSSITPPLPNSGVLSDDSSGETAHAVEMSLVGAGKYGSAIKVFVNDIGYPIVKDFGVLDPDESFKISIKFADAESLANCSRVRLKFVISDIPGDLGASYQFFARAEITDFSAHTPGSWQQVQFYKSDFVMTNYSGSALALGWGTVTAVAVEVMTKDPITGAGTCGVSFDNLWFSPVGKLNGADLQWTYTFYNSKADTESDYADPFANNIGDLTNESVSLTFPATPLTNPPMANPDKIRIYRMGGTLTQFQLVGEIAYTAGFEFTWSDNVGDEYAGDVLEEDNQLPPEGVEGVEIWDNRMWTWGGVSLDGIAEPLNRLRFSKGTRIEHFPSDNYIYVGSGNEEIMRVLEHDGELFVFTVTKVYRIVGQDGNYRAQSTAVNQGLTGKFCACRGSRGLYMRSYDGIWEFPNGRKISEPISQIFSGETVNGIEAVAEGRQAEEAMGFYDSKVFFSYCSTADTSIRNDRTLIWDTQYERWSWYIYGAQGLYAEPETNLLIGANLTQWYSVVPGVPVTVRRSGNYPMRLEHGNGDECSDPDTGALITYGIPVIIDTREYDLGYPDQEKQFIDITCDADTQGYPVLLQASFDGGEFEALGIIQTFDRARIVFPVIMGEENSRLAVRMSVRISFESDPNAEASTRIFKLVHRILLEPPKHRTFVTDWDYAGSQGPKFFNSLWVEMDTFGVPLAGIEVQIDQALIKTIEDNVSASGRRKFYYGLGVDVRGTLVRLKFLTADDNEVKVYDFGFDAVPEPALLNSIQSPWTDVGFPYRKLWKHVDLDIDTEGKLIEFNFWLDNEIRQTFQVMTTARQHVVQSFDQELFGKLGRLTVDIPALGSDGIPQGVRMYSPPQFIVDQRNPDVTIADSFEQVLRYERIKILKQLYYVLENPNADVTLQLYVDNTLKDTLTLAAVGSLYPRFAVRRQDFRGGMKGKIFRFVFTSSQAFEIDWPRTHAVLRDVNTEDTHRRPRLEPPQTY